MTIEIVEEKGFTVDEEGFQAAMKEQKETARKARKVTNYMGADVTVYESIDPSITSKFVGYDRLTHQSKVTVLTTEDELVDALTDGQTGTIIVDETPFYATMGGQEADTGVITLPDAEFQVKDTDSGVNAGTIAVTVDGTAVSTVTKTAIDGGYKCTCTSPTLKDGSHTISVKASDNDGNAAAAKTATFTVDTVPPTLQITAPSNDLITNKKTVTVSGKTDDVSSKPVTVTVNGATVTVGTDGTFTKDVTLAEGANTITIVAKDKAGKTTTVTRKVTVDTSAPVIKSVTLTPNPVDCGKTFIIAVEITD